MKLRILILFFFFPSIAFCQLSDSTIIIQRVDSLLKEVLALIEHQNFDAALDKVNTVETLVIDQLGQDTRSYGDICYHKGKVWEYTGNSIKAEEWYGKAATNRKKWLGAVHEDYTSSLINLGLAKWRNYKLVEAEECFKEAIHFDSKIFGVRSYEYASGRVNLASLYLSWGKYEEAETGLLESRAILAEVKGKLHPSYSICLNNLGILYSESAKYEQAIEILTEAVENRKQIVGLTGIDYGESMSNLANLYWSIGEYDKAEALYLNADKVLTNAKGKDRDSYYINMVNLANLYNDIGVYDKAEALYQKALRYEVTKPALDSLSYANDLGNLAGVYVNQGAFDKAEPKVVEALKIREKLLGKNHPLYATSLKNLAVIYEHKEDYNRVEQIYSKAKDIYERVLGEEHIDYILTLQDLGQLHYFLGKNQSSKQLLLQADGLFKKVLGENNKAYVENLYSLAFVFSEFEDFDEANTFLQKAIQLDKAQLLDASTYLSRTELTAYVTSFRSRLNLMFSLAKEWNSFYPNCYNSILFYKGFLLDVEKRLDYAIRNDSSGNQQFLKLKAHRRLLAKEYAKPIAERSEVKAMEEKVNTVEKSIARYLANTEQIHTDLAYKDIQAQLKEGEVAIEFVHFEYGYPYWNDSIMYVALVLKHGETSPHFVPLFEEGQLKRLLNEESSDKKTFLNQLYKNSSSENFVEKTLYQLIWQPLDDLLKEVETVYLASSGLLHRINLGAIMVDEEEAILNKFNIVTLNSTRQLAVEEPFEPKASHATDNLAMLYGGIYYNMDSLFLSNSFNLEEEFALDAYSGSIGFDPYKDIDRGRSWNYLKGTAEEINEIEQILNRVGATTEVLMEYNATEESFKELGKGTTSAKIIHLATHGYFYPDPKEKNTRLSGSAFKVADHPMIRSGLILAGGNQAWRGKEIPEGLEDGILTAYEVSQMNLSGTELVVLSACETGLGDIEGNEGVYGLQRAFKIAGAKRLIMSLWSVPDTQTKEMMIAFYKYWLEGKMTIQQAFQNAQEEMCSRYVDHYYWAGFVLIE